MNINMNCAICLQDENEVSSFTERMITKCNHFFHKTCFYKANLDFENIICPLCRTPCPSEYTIKNYLYSEIPKNIRGIFKRILKIATVNTNSKSHKEFYENFVVSGSFAVYIHHLLFTKTTPNWLYGDIDIYYKNPSDIENETLNINNVLYVNTTTENATETTYTYKNKKIISVKKYSSFSLNNITKDTEFIQKLENYDLINVKNDTVYNIVKTFDLDCCKVALQFTRNGGLIIYIHNSFYIDSYKIINKEKADNTMKRVEKYKKRGFLNF